MSERAVRTVVVWCPDWPVAAAIAEGEVRAGASVAVLAKGRVLACSAAARAAGVRRGLRRREAQGRCPDLFVLAHHPEQEARCFEPVVAAVEQMCSGIEVIRPGLLALPARGPARYYGGEPALLDRLWRIGAMVPALSGDALPCRAGIADGILAATVIARTAAGIEDAIVPPGGSADFLAVHPVDVLGQPELTTVLRRLGIRTLGAFAELPADDVLARFGSEGAVAHRRARGLDAKPLATRRPEPELAVKTLFDPPVERVDTAAFAARALAVRFHESLADRALGCLRLSIVARTEHGEELCRCWRHDGVLSAAAISDRVRWQLDGWLTHAGAGDAPTSGILELELIPEQVIPHSGHQLGLWGGAGEAEDRADRALTRVQGLFGPDAVLTPVLAGGRHSRVRTQLVPWGEPRIPDRDPDEPWPGHIPAPSAATVLPAPQPVQLTDAADVPIEVTGRGVITADPGRLRIGAGPVEDVESWAGPWPVKERWWDPKAARRRVHLQAVTASGTARLLVLERGSWWVEAVYD
ncbi:MAG TPA: DNA polymerase Y family protein [Mycobacteriales bacterium]|nr:DNA polymerase Y family protein [Mycobacteriales bacterium]